MTQRAELSVSCFRHVVEDAYDGVYQLAHNPELLAAFCGTAVSIAFFNFAGKIQTFVLYKYQQSFQSYFNMK